MAEVYLARPDGDPRSVVYALKCILPHFADDPRFVQMFHRELKIAGGLCHPNLISVLDHGRVDGRHFMVMEYVHGPDLAKLLRTAGEHDLRPPLGAALCVVIAAARGLHHLHEWPGPHGGAPAFVHRDVSPSNVLVSYDGVVKVTDFGVATATAHTRTTEAGGVKGKMGYLSPEQCRSEAMDRRSDVFALGVLLFETTLGERLFYADNDYAVMHQIVSAHYDHPRDRDPEYSPDLEAIVLTALAADREDRFATAAALADALEAFAIREQIAVGPEVLAAWVASLIPWEPYPAFTPPPPPAISARVAAPYTHASTPTRRSRGPWIAAAVGVPLALVGVAAAAMLVGAPAADDVETSAGQDTPADESTPPVQSPEAEPVPIVQAPPVVVAPPAASVQDAPPPEDPPPAAMLVPPEPQTPTAQTPTQNPDIQDQAEREEVPPTEAAPAPRRRKKIRRRKKANSPTPGYDLDAPRPPQ